MVLGEVDHDVKRNKAFLGSDTHKGVLQID